MKKDDSFKFNSYWYDIWEKQSQQFFTLTKQHLQACFDKEDFNIQEHFTQIQAWFNDLKQQWLSSLQTQEKNSYQEYADLINNIFNNAAELMLKKWEKKNKTSDPIKNMVELYALWLDCCHHACQKAQQTKTYQALYGDIMNSAMQFWKEMSSK